jgi:hypothetical protein
MIVMGFSSTRACLGFSAGAIAALLFHQGLAEMFDLAGIGRMAAFRLQPAWPFGLPAVVNLTFWSALYGVAFALAAPRFSRPLWQVGIGLGLIAGVGTLFVTLPLNGVPLAHGWHLWPIARTVILNLCWGAGTGVLLPMLRPRPLLVAVTPAVRA